MTTNQTIDGVPLLPCPFCGGEPYVTHDHYVDDDLSPMPCVECRSCSAHLKARDWNRRAQPADQPPSIFTSRFLTDVMTASGLVAHGKRDKKFAERLADECSQVRSALYAEQPAPVAVVLPDRDRLRDIIAKSIGFDTYDCTRVWCAWGAGTMSDDDFVAVVDQDDRLYEIVDACLDEVARLNAKS